MRKLIILMLCSVLACSARAGEEGAADGLSEKARMLMEYQSFMRGDRDGAVRFALTASRELLGTPLAELAVRIALLYDPAGLSGGGVGEVEARRVLTAESGLSPGHRDALRRFIARSFAMAGRRGDAMEVHNRRGLAMSWLKAGPFPGRGGLENRPLPPFPGAEEEDIIGNPPDAAMFRRWREDPPWRRIPENRSFPAVRPWAGAGKNADGAMLLFTTLNIEDTDNDSAFHVFADTSWRLYVDGSLLSEADGNARETPREHMVPFALSPGRHTVLLQLPPPPGADASKARVALRLESASAFTWDCGAAPPEPVRTVSARRDPRPLRHIADLRRAAAESPILMSAYALACLEQGMADTGEWWAERAAAEQPGDAVIEFLAGLTASHNSLLPPARRRDIAAARQENALAAKPDLVPALVHLAGAASDAGRAREAADYLARAYAANPKSLDVLIARVEWARKFASAGAARKAMDECGEAFPRSPQARITAASLPRGGFLDMDRRLAACRAALEAGPYVPETSLDLAEALADSGNAGEVEFVLKNALELFAGDAEILGRIATVYSRVGMHGDAAAAVQAAIRIVPEDAGLWRRLGDFLMEAGDVEAAKKYWRTSLAGDPGQFALRDMLGVMEGNPTRLYNEGGHDALALTAAANPEAYSGNVVRLLDRAVLTFAHDGSYRRLTHGLDLALNRRGGEALTGVDAGGELLTARIVFPNGNTLEPEPSPGRGGLRLPVIMPGAAREIRTLESFRAGTARDARAAGPWHFQDPSGRMPLVTSEYVVRAPRGFPLVYSVRDMGNRIDFDMTRDGDTDVYRWSAALDLPGHEPDAVHFSERIPSVEAGVKTTWDDIAGAELRRLDGKLVPSMRMRELLPTLYRAAPGARPEPLDAARAIYRFVCDNIDPAPAGETAAHIYTDRMGDRNLLLLSMLRAAGLDADPAAARPAIAFMHPPVWTIPKRDIFPVPLVRLDIPGGNSYWLDTRFDSLPFGKVPDDLSGAAAITFLPSGPLFETLPTLPAEDSMALRAKTIRLPGAGDAPLEVSGRSLRRGVAGLLRDRQLADADVGTRRRLLLDAIYPVFPDAALREFEVLRTDENEASSLERYEASARAPLEERGGGVRAVSLCLVPPGVISTETRNLRTRRTACHIKSIHMAEDRNVFRLPEGGRFVRLPAPAHIPGRYGVYQLRVNRRGDDSVEIIRTYHIPAQRIPHWSWPDFLDFLDQVDLAEKQWIEYAVGE